MRENEARKVQERSGELDEGDVGGGWVPSPFWSSVALASLYVSIDSRGLIQA